MQPVWPFSLGQDWKLVTGLYCRLAFQPNSVRPEIALVGMSRLIASCAMEASYSLRSPAK